jgi:hypothetical protein
MSDFLYEQWVTIYVVLLVLTLVFGICSGVLHHYHHRPFTDRKNWGSILVVGTASAIYALLGAVDTWADMKGEAGRATRAVVASHLMFVKTAAIFAAGFVGLVLLRQRDELEVLHNPSVPEYYHHLFGEFDGKQFFGFGAPFQLEGEWHRKALDGTGECSDLAREQLRRLTRIDEAIYIFHTQSDFQRAKNFFESEVFPYAESEIPQPHLRDRLNRKGKIVLYEPIVDLLPHDLLHSYSFFLGTRKGQPCCILYPAHRLRPITRQPEVAVLIHNDEEFFYLLKTYFVDRLKEIEKEIDALIESQKELARRQETGKHTGKDTSAEAGSSLKVRYRRHVWTPKPEGGGAFIMSA